MKIHMELDDRGMRIGFDDFKTANKVSVRNTLNTVAALSRRNAVKEVKKDFTLRNNFTVSQIQYDQATGTNINKMKSEIGATKKADYMETQETGGIRPRKGRATAIPQKSARRGMSRTKPVLRSRYISRLKPRIIHGAYSRATTPKSKAVAQMAMAYKKRYFVKRRNNLYYVESFRSANGRVKVKMRHLYYITAKSIIVKKETWLEPAIEKPVRDFGNIYRSQLERRLKDVRFK